jgi:hypothetical protein
MRENPWEWEEEDLLALIASQATESTELEFKACDALGKTDGKRMELSRDGSSFANAAGGTIVYGMIEDKETKVAAALDAGYDPSDVSADWIHQVINSRIRPPLHGVRVNMVQLATHGPGKVAYVLWIPQGRTAHQAADNRYYRRRGTERLQMEHYEIVDVMQRELAPRVSMRVEIEKEVDGEVALIRRATGLALGMVVFAVNEPTAGACEYSQHQVFLPSRFITDAKGAPKDVGLVGSYAVPLRQSATRITAGAGRLEFGCYQFEYSPSDLPIFPGEKRPLCMLDVEIPDALNLNRFLLLWRCRAPRSEPAVGAVMFLRRVDEFWHFEPMSVPEAEASAGVGIHLAP